MDCNFVFTVLTRAPFPTGEPVDVPVERHLLGCESCREIAEALRPCEGLRHESLPVVERRQLPRYRSELTQVLTVDSESAQRSRGTELPASLYSGAKPSPRRSHGWQSAFGSPSQTTPPIASFALAPRSHSGLVWDLASVAAMAGAVALGGWGLGWLTL